MNALRHGLLVTVTASLFTATLLAPAGSYGEGRDCRLKIAGRVTRSSDRGPLPQPRIPIHLVNQKGEKLFTVRTDRDGAYAFENVCSGVYTVYPGPLLVEDTEDPPIPSLYTPAFARFRVPARINDAINPAHIDFVRNEPPPRNPDDFYRRRR